MRSFTINDRVWQVKYKKPEELSWETAVNSLTGGFEFTHAGAILKKRALEARGYEAVARRRDRW